jgi:hypothetical protein
MKRPFRVSLRHAILDKLASADRHAMVAFGAQATRLGTRLTDLISSNLFTALLIAVALAGVAAKLLSPDAPQMQPIDADGGSASITISNRSDCLHLRFDNDTAGVTTTGMTPCPGGEGHSVSRFSAISNAFQHK